MSRECGYTHDVSGDRFEDVPGDTWRCSRAPTGEGRCVFHAHPEEVGEGVVREAFLDAVDDEGGALRLIGAHIGSLSLDYAILEGPSNNPIDLRDATVLGEFSARYVTAERPLRLEGAHLQGPVDLEDATFARRVDLGEATFDGRVSFRLASFESWLDLRETEFRGAVYMRVATFERGIYGVDATFHAAADFLNTQFNDVANFYRATFHRGAVFDKTTFRANAQFYEASIDAPAVKLASSSGSPRSERELQEGVALSLDGITCDRELRLAGATLGGDVVVTESELGRDLRCGDLSTEGDVVVDCSGAATITGEISGSDGSVEYLLAGATVGEVDLVDGTTFDVFRFDETTFDGFDFGAYKRDLADRDWRLHDPESAAGPEELENLYLRAKNGADDVGETRASAEFFIQEMTYRRAGHRRRAMTGDGVRQRLRAVSRWVSNTALQVSCGYGERPLRPVVFSTVLIALFAGLYAWLDAPIAYGVPVGYFIFSIEGFVSLILGLPEIGGSLLGFFVALEGFLGGFLIALLVFTLTRSVSR